MTPARPNANKMNPKTLLISALCLSFLLGTGASWAADTATTMVAKVIESFCEGEEDCSIKNRNNDLKELKELAKEEELPFGNLYLFMYRNIAEGPQEAAVKELAGLRGRLDYNKSELSALMMDGDISVITKKRTERGKNNPSAEDLAASEARIDSAAAAEAAESQDPFFTEWMYRAYAAEGSASNADIINSDPSQSAILKEYNYLRQLYEEEVALQRKFRRLGYQSIAAEMFMNNDRGDSANIDLLYDLDLIHYLMFNQHMELPDRSGDVTLSSEDSEDEEMNLPKTPDQNAEVILSEVSENACMEDEALRNAIDTFTATPPEFTAEDLPGENNASGKTGAGSGSSSGSDSSSGSSDTSAEVQSGKDAFEDALDALASTPGDWTRSLPCNEIFCVKINLVTDTENPVVKTQPASANCIACHTGYILASMEETLSKSLNPNKVSMNVMEDATCKQGSKDIRLDINVYAVARPIVLDPGDEIDETPDQNIADLKAKWVGISGIPIPGAYDRPRNNVERAVVKDEIKDAIKEARKLEAGKTNSDAACDALFNLAGSSLAGASKLDEAAEACTAAREAIVQENQEIFDSMTFQSQMDFDGTLYSQMSAELIKLMQFFEAFEEPLNQSQEILNKILTEKNYC